MLAINLGAYKSQRDRLGQSMVAPVLRGDYTREVVSGQRFEERKKFTSGPEAKRSSPQTAHHTLNSHGHRQFNMEVFANCESELGYDKTSLKNWIFNPQDSVFKLWVFNSI